MSEDKKFKLDELPEKGSGPVPQKKQTKPSSPASDPRVSKLKKLDDQSKVEAMERKWKFDAREYVNSSLILVVILVIFELTPFYENYIGEITLMNKHSGGFVGTFVRSITIYFEFLIKHPVLLVLVLPLFVKFYKESEFYFELSFDGISTVKEVPVKGSKTTVHRTFIKWNDIARVEHSKIGHKEILKVYSRDGHIGDLIWYIDIVKKRVVKSLIMKLVATNHPLREFLEKEKELM